MKLEELQKHIDMPANQVRMIERMIPAPEMGERSQAYVIMCVLVCDFFVKSGKKLEDVIGFVLEQDCLREYARDLIHALETYEATKERVQLPMAFIEVLDNRYLIAINKEGVYDAVEGGWIPHLPGPPVFSLSLGLHALFIRTVATPFGCGAAAKAFMNGTLVKQVVNVVTS